MATTDRKGTPGTSDHGWIFHAPLPKVPCRARGEGEEENNQGDDMNAKTQLTEAPAELTGTQLITLDPDKYVAAVFAPFRERLDAAKDGAKDVKAEVGTKEGMLVAIKQRALFRSLRIDIEAARKARKAPVLEISKKLDGRAHELTDEIAPDEDRFDAAIKAEEGSKERERTEREAAEAACLLLIQN